MKDTYMRHNTFKLWQFFRINKDNSFSLISAARECGNIDVVSCIVCWKLKQLAQARGGVGNAR